MTIDNFSGRYAFLSNFYWCEGIKTSRGYAATTVEHAYQAEKAATLGDHLAILSAETPQEAKEIGHSIERVPKWEQKRVAVMRRLLRQKFKDRILRQLLLATGVEEIIEGNKWKDTYWGVDMDKRSETYLHGKNWLGRLLMETREYIMNREILGW